MAANTHEHGRKWTSFVSVLDQSVLRKAVILKAAAAHLYQVLNGQQRILNTNSRWTWPKAKPWGLPRMRGDFCSKLLPDAHFRMRPSAALKAFTGIAVTTKSNIYPALFIWWVYIAYDQIYRESKIFMAHIIQSMDFTMPSAPGGVGAILQNEHRPQK